MIYLIEHYEGQVCCLEQDSLQDAIAFSQHSAEYGDSWPVGVLDGNDVWLSEGVPQTMQAMRGSIEEAGLDVDPSMLVFRGTYPCFVPDSEDEDD